MDVRIQIAIRLIEARLYEPPSLAVLARALGLSVYHFHHLFHTQTGEAVSAYCKRIRLESAATRLRWTEVSILAIADACGYASQSAFTRAFSAHFGTPPTRYRRHAAAWRQRIPSWSQEESVSIREVQGLPCLSRRYVGDYRLLRRHWQDFLQTLPEWLVQPASKATFFGLVYDDPHITDPDRIRYDCCVRIPTASDAPAGTLPVRTGLHPLRTRPGHYAVVDYEGPLSGSAMSRSAILDRWLPNTCYTPAPAPAIELFDEPPAASPRKRANCRILVPLM